ncbi:MAG TPA: DUF262 domain-containing protein [Longimicrobium sp.]
MPALYNPEKRTIGQLLTMTNPPIVVPQWQRNYSWTVSEVETFWKDLLGFDRLYPDNNIEDQEYFLGSLVIVDQNTTHLLLDGQQRLATAAILLSVIRDFLARYSKDAALRTSTRYLMDYDDAQNRNIYKLTLNRYDRDFFRREILEYRDADYVAPNPQLESHRLIRKAREFFEKQFQQHYDQLRDGEAAQRWALRIQKVLIHHLSVVAVFSTDEENASTVFETLNDRGIGLSTPDLVRNLLLRRAAEHQRDEIIELWRVVLEIEADAKLNTFLRHYWISREGDVKSQSLYREMRDAVIDQNIDSLALSRQLHDSSLVYRDIVNAKDDDEDVRAMLADVNALGATMLYPAIMSANERLEPGDFKMVLRALLVTFVRHSVIGGLDNSQLETVVYEISRRLDDDLTPAAAVAWLRDFAPDDELLIRMFEGASLPKTAFARYVLKEIELLLRETEELTVATPSRVHVEHVYPQNPPADRRWENHFSALNRIGNLTLLARSLNTAIRNADFPTKKPRYQESNLLVTRDLLNYEEWNWDTVQERQKRLASFAPEIWRYPDIEQPGQAE